MSVLPTALEKRRQQIIQIAKGTVNTVFNTKFIPGQKKTIGEVVRDVKKNPSNYILSSSLAQGKLATGVKPLDTIGKATGQAANQFIETSTLGFVRPPGASAKTLPEKVGAGAGFVAGIVNPYGVAPKILGPVGKVGEKITGGIIRSRIAPQVVRNAPNVVKNVATAFGGEIAQSAAYVGAKRAEGEKKSFTEDLLARVVFRGAFGTVGKALKDVSPNAFKIDKNDETVLKGYTYRILNPKLPNVQRLDKEELKDLQNLAEHYLGDKFRTASTKKIAQAFEYFLARKGGGEAKFPRLSFVSDNPEIQQLEEKVRRVGWDGLADTEKKLARSSFKVEDLRDMLNKKPEGYFRAADQQAVEQGTKPEYLKSSLVGDTTVKPQDAPQPELIKKTAKDTGDRTPVVKRVVDSVKEAKTKVLEYVQNTDERVRQLTTKKGVKVDDASDPYLKATLYPGRVAERVNQGKEEVGAIIKDAKKLAGEFKTDLKSVRKEINDYLYYRHAPERNIALGENAAGITTKEAQDRLAALEASPQGAKIRALADRASELNKKTLDVLKDAGVLSDDLYDTLRTKYKNHVPLNRIFEETEDIGQALSGKGFDVRSTGIKRAKGSERAVDDILTNITTNYEQAVIRAEKNIVDQATLNFARNNKDMLGDLFEIKSPKAIGTTFDGKIMTEKTNDPTVLQMFENGKPVWIKIKDPNLAIALRGVGREKLGLLLNAVASFTRLYSGLATRFNPEFALPNKIRDLQETAIFLSAQKKIGLRGAAKMAVQDVTQRNTRDVMDYLRGKDSEGARLYKELKELGGTTGGFGLSTREQVSMDIAKLEKLANSKTRRIGDNLVKYIDNWNTIFEDSTRLGVYRQALKRGMSKDRAAFLAKEASINFNRMGRGGPVINALYMFSNASIQGSTKMLRSLKNPKVLGAVTVAVGSAVATVNQWNDQVDPEWREKVTKWDRLNGLPVVLPNPNGEGVKYITIPVSWGVKPIKVMADYAYDATANKGFDPKKMVNDTMTAMIEAYNPVGGTDLVSATTPTALDIPVEIARNQSWTGSKIRPDSDKNAPADIQYFQSLKETRTGQVAISIAELLQSKAGVAISPANIKYAFDGYVGGVGRAASKFVNTIGGAATGKLPSADEYPIVSRFYRERTGEETGSGAGGSVEEIQDLLGKQSRERFKLKAKAETLYDELSMLPKDEANKRAKAIYDKDRNLYEKILEISDDKKLGLTYSERLIKQLGVENGERAKYIVEQADKFKSREEKNNYIRNLYDKKIVSDDVLDQISFLIASR